MKNLKKFEDFISTEINETVNNLSDNIYSALSTVKGFDGLGMDQQGELVKIIVKKLNSYGIK